MSPEQAVEVRRSALDLAFEFLGGTQLPDGFNVLNADHRDALTDLASFLAPEATL